MDRNETLRLSRLAAFGELTENDISVLLMQYCEEHGKPIDKATIFITSILRNNILLSHCVGVALEFYERKFTICKVWSAPNPSNNMEQRKLLQIF